MSRKLYRSSRDCKIAGVCGGIAEYFDIDPSIVRILWLVLSVFYGAGVVLYIACWLILPWDYEINNY
ncbi:phage shock protein C (PspC) family protein [Anaerosphaera aminiphila DSM 21120]|uniref:Phage shock protein C (PspC) family protein n=1 Tax=Anaerosphaera aminiphila DSM 21120 TaxID=1120995 RepID=A0A1M5PEZ5_9FIRM|nr:PspC domain-containing protein [Anaerosphaera aminiphila]SHH00346.1 phage shock protein C (PspC) family protein [Anaerosphaera aminiphila DSM 21120]